jgi:hypothetical protein
MFRQTIAGAIALSALITAIVRCVYPQSHQHRFEGIPSLPTSTRASRAGNARSKIGYRMSSGSMTLIDFRQLWMLLTVEES